MANTRAKITPEKYAEMLKAYREQAELNHQEVSDITGIPVRTCNKAWLQGYPRRKGFPEGGRPIKDVLTGEGMLARAALAREDQGEDVDRREVIKEQLREAQLASTADLIKSRAEQGKTVRAARSNTRGLLLLSNQMLHEGAVIVKSVKEDIARLIAGNKLDLATKMRLLSQIASFSKTAVDMARTVEILEGLALGDPKAILAMMSEEDGDGMTEAQCLQTLQQATKALERSQESGIIDAEFTEFSPITVERKPED